MEQRIRVGIICNNQVLLAGLAQLVEAIGRYEIILQASTNDKLIQTCKAAEEDPEVLLINTDEMGNDEKLLVSSLRALYSNVKILMMSNYNNQYNIIKAIKYGANGYVGNSCDVNELHKALLCIYYTDIYYNDAFLNSIKLDLGINHLLEATANITVLERQALSLFATELSYKEIAETMNTSLEIVEAYRNILLEKFNVTSRVGLVVWAHAIGEISLRNETADMVYARATGRR